MEQFKSIDEYIATEMCGKIVRKKEFPIAGVALLAVGALLSVLMVGTHNGSNLQTLLLTAATISIAIGLLLTAMGLSGAQWHYSYVATGSRLKERKVYLSATDYSKAVEALAAGSYTALGRLTPLVSSNGLVRVLRSNDGSIALLQACRNDVGHMEYETPPVVLDSTDVAALETLCR